MSDAVIKVENLGKMYRLGEIGTGTLSHDLNRYWHKLRGKEDPYSMVGAVNDRSIKSDMDYVWALQNISFEVGQGEVVGIIGKNGAGKSTLLKLLSKVTGPTTGRITMEGRIASLLEVGTGFHSELTGRENIYLNGAILGMTKQEITRKLDEIVDFAGVARYLDTPVKRYSSGMNVRLGFAVAAHLEPEILIVDEVLAVGDAEFQRKAVGKIKDVSTGHGRTVLFVSHNMTSINNICNKCMVLDNGQVSYPVGDVQGAVNHYFSLMKAKTEIALADRTDRSGEGNMKMVDFQMFNKDTGKQIPSILSGQDIELRIYFEAYDTTDVRNVHAAIAVTRVNGPSITVLGNHLVDKWLTIDGVKNGYFSCTIKKFPFMAGEYTINIALRKNGILQDWVRDAYVIIVENGDFYGTGKTLPPGHPGILVEQDWNLYA